MIEIKETQYEGYECIQLSNKNMSLWATVSTGPRILGFSAFRGRNLMALLPNVALECPGEGKLPLIGGHRLWYAPEVAERTYLPDTNPVKWETAEDGIVLTQQIERSTGIQKVIQIGLDHKDAKVKLTHRLFNHGQKEVELAPWAITQVKPGGVGILPQKTDKTDLAGLQPNRSVILWPYTKLSSEHIKLSDEAVAVYANMTEGFLKVGIANPEGWIGYLLDDLLFVKRSDYKMGADYLDLGASSQIYCCYDFLELETLGPKVALSPGEETLHVEEWQVYQAGEYPAEAANLLEKL